MGIAQGYAVGSQVQLERDKLRQNAEMRNQELQQMGYSFEDGKMSIRPNSAAELNELQNKEAVQLAKGLQAKLAAQATDTGFEDYSMTGDAGYLQKVLDNDPAVKQAWMKKGVQLVSNIDFSNDTSLLASSGFEPSFYDTPEKQETLKKNVFKVYDGQNWSISLANQTAAETGVMKRLGPRRSQSITENYKQLVGMLSGPKVSPYAAEGHKYEPQIMKAAEENDVPPNLIASMIQVESSGNPNAVSSKGAGGLMQIMPPTAQDLGVTDVHNPDQAINGGAKYMRQLLDRYEGDVPKALAAYNAGMGNVDKYNGIPPFGETQQYVNKVLAGFDQAEQYYGRNAEQTINTILEHKRALANAEKGTTNANVDKEVSQQDRLLDQADKELKIKNDANLIKLASDGTTSTQKDIEAAKDTASQVVETFGGMEQFMATDFSIPENYNKAISQVMDMEELSNTRPSEADKKEMSDLRVIVNLSKPIEKLSAAETGIIDKNLGDLKKYLSDDVKGVEAKAAWAAFRNAYLAMLSGKAVTPQEAERQAEAFGKLGTKLGPALQQFEVALNQTYSRLDSLSKGMSPISAKVRLGADADKLNAIRENINQGLRRIQGITEPGYTDSQRRSLDDIFGAQGQ